jgi:hypothetical protein
MFKVGRHTVWNPTPLLAQAVGGPLSLLQQSDRAVDWLLHRIRRGLRIEGWRVRRTDDDPVCLCADDDAGHHEGWMIKVDRRGASKAVRLAIDDHWTMVHAVGSTPDIVSVLRRTKKTLSQVDQKRIQVHALASILRRSDMENTT